MIALDAVQARHFAETGEIVVWTPVGTGFQAIEGGFVAADGERLSVADLVARCPSGQPGARVEMAQRELYGKLSRVGVATVTSVTAGFLEDISDAQILAAGRPSWSNYAYCWNALYPKCPWDLNPLCWVAAFAARP